MRLEGQTFDTPEGEMRLWGRPGVFQGQRPALLAIHGTFDNQFERFLSLSDDLEIDVLGAMIPGMGCPHLRTPSIEAFAKAYESVLAQMARDVRVVLGESAGALLALTMEGPFARLALDPLLRTTNLWPGAV